MEMLDLNNVQYDIFPIVYDEDRKFLSVVVEAFITVDLTNGNRVIIPLHKTTVKQAAYEQAVAARDDWFTNVNRCVLDVAQRRFKRFYKAKKEAGSINQLINEYLNRGGLAK